MATYRYRTWAGRTVVVEAYSVAFERAHVVFSDIDGRIIHAEDNQNCSRLTDDEADGSAILQADGDSRRLLPPNPPKETP